MTPAAGEWGLPELAEAREAEDFFEALGVAWDPGVLRTCRLQVLHRFGAAAAALAGGGSATPPVRREALRRALREAHDAFASGAARGGLVAARVSGPVVRLVRRG